MTMRETRTPAPIRGLHAALGLGLLALVLLVSLGYGFAFPYECRAQMPAALCRALSLGPPRGLCAAALLALVLCLRPGLRRAIAPVLRPVPGAVGTGLLAAGAMLILAPLALVNLGPGVPAPAGLLALWGGGLALAAAGLASALLVLPLIDRGVLCKAGLPLGAALVAGALLPDLVLAIQPLWRVQAVTEVTFNGVVALLRMLGQDVTTDLAEKALVIDTFGVLVGPQCSGVEGFAILTVFTLGYLALFRRELNLWRAWILWPAGLLLSWGLNILRIAVLMLIGRYLSPDLAVNGFHSHAGWLFFLTLALGVVLAAHNIRWLQRDSHARPRARPAFRADPAVAMTLPFAVFMASSTLTSAIAELPALLYPLRAGLMALVLALCWPGLRTMAWRFDPLAAGAGLLCGGLWLATAPESAPADQALSAALAAMGPLTFGLWVASRVAGTALLVPVVEELFFRGYLQTRLALGPGLLWQGAGIAVSALLFGYLHDRMLAATLSGVLFGALAWRSGRIGDAVVAHVAANAVIAIAAFAQGAWHLI